MQIRRARPTPVTATQVTVPITLAVCVPVPMTMTFSHKASFEENGSSVQPRSASSGHMKNVLRKMKSAV